MWARVSASISKAWAAIKADFSWKRAVYSMLWASVIYLCLAGLILAFSKNPWDGIVADKPCMDMTWKHVYNPTRLQVHQMCVTVTGIIVDATHGKRKDGVRKEADGDCHGWLKLDPGQEKYLNAGNMSNEEGNLVYEVVCLYKVTQKDAVGACKGYKNAIKLAPIGSHVKMSGSWVTDDNHAHWMEIHPVSALEVIP